MAKESVPSGPLDLQACQPRLCSSCSVQFRTSKCTCAPGCVPRARILFPVAMSVPLCFYNVVLNLPFADGPTLGLIHIFCSAHQVVLCKLIFENFLGIIINTAFDIKSYIPFLALMRYLTPLGIRFVFIELHYQPVFCLLMMVLYTETCQE